MQQLPPIPEMQRAWQGRDASYDGLFYIGVKTTGIFCRPTCSARKPLAKNVEYFATPAQALFAGFRACKRCRPLAADAQPDWAARLIEDVDRHPDRRIREGDLRARGIDPGTVRRYFQKEYGMTFQAFARSRRLSGALATIRAGGAADDAAADSGFESLSGFRAAFGKAFDATPGAARGADCVRLAWIRSPLGPLVAGATDDGICLLEFSDRRMLEAQFQALQRHFRMPVIAGSNTHLKALERELGEYFAGHRQRFTVPLRYPGSPFQQQVWRALLDIPYGETRSYQDIARAIGDAAAVRAVGRTNGLNRISIVIPCHRVVNKDGSLGGYGGGLRRKEYLLSLERK